MADAPRETTLSASQYRQLVDFVDEKEHRGMIRLAEIPHMVGGYVELQLLDAEGAPIARSGSCSRSDVLGTVASGSTPHPATGLLSFRTRLDQPLSPHSRVCRLPSVAGG
jgi:hypothetical protein